ncbi:MAG: response regulator, partial [Xanthomonadales bacterium]|nr:response regulator [Xanthomonadales bacterium]
ELALLAFGRTGVADRLRLARDGEEALRYLLPEGEYAEQRKGALPKVVLLDIKLPGVSGLDVLETLRSDSRTRYLPVVMLTSSARVEDLERSYALGANSFIKKPVDFGEFSSAIERIQHYWLGLNETPGQRGDRDH